MMRIGSAIQSGSRLDTLAVQVYLQSNHLVFVMIVKEIDKGQQKRADDKEQRNRVDHRGGAIPHLQVEVDWQGRTGTNEKEGGIEIFKAHQKRHGPGGNDRTAQIGQGDVNNNLERAGTEIKSRLLQATVEFAQPGRYHQGDKGGDKGKLANPCSKRPTRAICFPVNKSRGTEAKATVRFNKCNAIGPPINP